MNNITEFEFNTIMEYFRNKTTNELFNLNCIIKILKKDNFDNELTYRILGTPEFEITNSSIRGKIPSEIILNLYDKYVNDGIFNYPIDFLIDQFVDDEFVEEKDRIMNLQISKEEKTNLLVNAYDELYKRCDEDKYLEYFYIPTKEVLIDFIIAIINYNRKIINLDELPIDTEDFIMYNIKAFIIEKANPNIITSIWLNKIGYPNQKQVFINKKLKNKINELDNTINPFLSSTILLNNIKEYDSSLEINLDVNDKNYTRFNNLMMNIKRIDTSDEVSYKRDENEILFSVHGNINNADMYLEHKYKDDKEIITYELKDDDYTYVEYDVHNNMLFKTNNPNFDKDKKEFYFVNAEELELLMIKLDELIDYTKGITLDNMTNTKSFERVKKISS